LTEEDKKEFSEKVEKFLNHSVFEKSRGFIKKLKEHLMSIAPNREKKVKIVIKKEVFFANFPKVKKYLLSESDTQAFRNRMFRKLDFAHLEDIDLGIDSRDPKKNKERQEMVKEFSTTHNTELRRQNYAKQKINNNFHGGIPVSAVAK